MTQQAPNKKGFGACCIAKKCERNQKLFAISLIVEMAQCEEEADEDGGLDSYDEREVGGEAAIILFDGKG